MMGKMGIFHLRLWLVMASNVRLGTVHSNSSMEAKSNSERSDLSGLVT